MTLQIKASRVIVRNKASVTCACGVIYVTHIEQTITGDGRIAVECTSACPSCKQQIGAKGPR